MRGAAAGDGIEFVAPRSGLFGSSFDVDPMVPATGPAHFGDEEPPGRWSTIVAILAVLGLIAVGVIAAAPWQDDAAPSPTPTTVPATTAPASTAPPESTPAADGARPAAPGYLLGPDDVPEGFATQWVSAPTPRSGSPRLGWLELWATPSATRTSGSWISIESVPYSFGMYGQLGGADAVRLAVGDRIGMSAVDATGVTVLQVEIDDASAPDGPSADTWTATITSYGWEPDALTRLAAGLTLDEDGQPVYGEEGLPSGFRLVTSMTGLGWGLATEMFDRLQASVGYMTADGRELTLSTLRADPLGDRTLYDFLLAPVPGEPMTGPQTFWAEGDLTLIIGTIDGAPGTTVQWSVGESTILLSGDLPTSDLRALAEQVREGTRAEWRALYRESLEQRSEPDVTDLGVGPMIAEGTFSLGGTWQLATSHDGQFGQIDIDWTTDDSTADGPFGWGFSLADQLQTMTLPEAVIALAALPAASGATSMRVAGEWGERSVPLVAAADVRAGLELVVGLIDVVELGPFTVEVLDANGAVLDSTTVGRPTPASAPASTG